LSNIFSATFNNSEKFQKLFLKFINSKVPHGKLYSKTRVCFNDGKMKCIPDILIYKNNDVKIVIENKIELELTPQQLDNYKNISELGKLEKFALVKYFFPTAEYKDWEIFQWSTLYSEIKIKLSKFLSTEKNKEQFIINQFLKHLENLNMDIPDGISKKDFKLLCDGFRQLKKSDPYFSRNSIEFFSNASKFVKYFQEIINFSKRDKAIRKKVGVNYQFNPFIAYNWNTEEDRKNKKFNTTFGAKIELKNRKLKIRQLGIEIQIDIKDYKKDYINVYSIDFNNDYTNESKYNLRGIKTLKFNKLRDFTIKTWKEILEIPNTKK
ncbi:MAG TPA: hypothetical protein DIS94_01035, partial [Bacteroidetes bacterium]|nr:hypothetical protein [Bacteroidota bacterium]